MKPKDRSRDGIAFQLDHLHLACRRTELAADEDLRKAVRDAIAQAGQKAIGSSLRKKAAWAETIGWADGIPFRRSDLDLDFACAVASLSPLPDFRLYSDLSPLQAGFLRVRKRSVRYESSMRQIEEEDSEDLLDKSAWTFRICEEIAEQPVRWSFTSDGTALLDIESAAIAKECEQQALRCTLTLLHRNSDGGTEPRARKLGEFRLQANKDRTQLLARPEAVIEAHAAAVGSAWMLIESIRFVLLGPMPGLALNSTAHPWACPFGTSDKQSRSANPTRESIYLPTELATRLLKRCHWILPKKWDLALPLILSESPSS